MLGGQKLGVGFAFGGVCSVILGVSLGMLFTLAFSGTSSTTARDATLYQTAILSSAWPESLPIHQRFSMSRKNDDRDYNPNQDIVQVIEGVSPSTRTKLGVKLSDNARLRVDRVDPNKGRCAVENCPESRAVDYAHILAQSTSDPLLTSLEYHWKMRYWTLHVHSRYNIVRLGVALHRMFDSSYWILVPTSEVVDWYYKQLDLPHAIRSEFRDFPAPEGSTFEYKLYPLPGRMDNLGINHQVPHAERKPRSEDFKTFVHPYTDLPSIRIHSHPRFVIVNSGMKLDTAFRRFPDKTLAKIVLLYRAWTGPIPDEDQVGDGFDDSDVPPPDNDDANSDKHTKIGRKDEPYKSRPGRTRTRQGTPTPSARRSGKSGGAGDRLSGETIFGRARSQSGGKMWDTRDSIAGWAQSVCVA